MLMALIISGLTGCYQRKVVPGYSFDETDVESIREQLGAIASKKVVAPVTKKVSIETREYVNEEEEEE